MRVLVTGATGYVGSRLVPLLVAAGHEVHAATRRPDGVDRFSWGAAVVPVAFDIEDESSIDAAVDGVQAVVYLVHSLGEGDFVTKDRQAAEAVVRAAERHGVERFVYLSGLVPDDGLSDHLRSRLQVEDVLLDSSVPAIVLRAAMLVGSGSTSFELMRRMTERVPLVPVPRWMCHTLQPIAVRDVLHLLVGALRGEPRNRHYDVGGRRQVTYRELLRLFARTAGLRRPQVVVPLVPRFLVGRLVSLVTGMPHPTVAPLVDSLSHDMVCRDDDAYRDLADPDWVFLDLGEAIGRSLSPRLTGTDQDADPQAPAETDPDWAGGEVSITSGLRHRPDSLVVTALRDVRTRIASRLTGHGSS